MTIIFNGENAVEEKYGKKYNTERVKQHLPLIEESWIVHWKDSSYVYWSNPSNSVNSMNPIHLSKTLNFQGSTLTSEEDVFHNEADGKIAYKLVIIIDFKIRDSSKFELIKYYRRTYPPNESYQLEFEQADSVLQKWGFKDYYSNLKNGKDKNGSVLD